MIAQTGASTQPYRFAGEAADATGLTYLRSRYYDPSLGRLASRDALAGDIRQSATLNRFGYAIDNPIRFTDPTGRKAQGLSPLADFANIHTAGACLTSTVNLFLWYWSSSVCRVIDETGQQAVLIINGNGFGPGLGFSDTPGAFVSNGRSVTDQAGAFSDFNASVGYPTWGGTYTKSTGTNAAGQQITSHIVSIGPGYGTPSITFGNSNTTVVTDPQLVQLYQSSLGNNLPAAP